MISPNGFLKLANSKFYRSVFSHDIKILGRKINTIFMRRVTSGEGEEKSIGIPKGTEAGINCVFNDS